MQCGYDDPSSRELYTGYSDQLIPIWKASDALYPSIYLYDTFSQYQTVAYIHSTGSILPPFYFIILTSLCPVKESLRCAGKNPNNILVLPYMENQYHGTYTLL